MELIFLHVLKQKHSPPWAVRKETPVLVVGEDRLLSEEQKRTVIIGAVITGIILQAVNIYLLGGIPLLSGYLKARAVTKIWLLSYLLFPPSVNVLLSITDPRRRNYIPVIIGTFLFALTGYRTTVVVILLSAFITVYYSKKPSAGKLLVFITVLLRWQ